MKSLLTLRCTLATALLLGVGGGAAAQSLGVIKAEAWVGRPLEATLPAAFEEGGEPCVHAEVFYGDTRLPADQVRAVVQGTGAALRVRVQSDMPIDEPVVTVAVRAGCRNTVTRRYTLLPDYPTAPLLADAGPASVLARPGGLMATALATQAAGAPPLKLKAGPRSMAAADAAPAVRRAAPGIVKARHAQAFPSARLRLEAWEPDASALLRVSASMAAPQEGAGRATAALLWQALNASPDQLLRTASTLRDLESELAQLRQAAGQTHGEVLALRRELEAPESLGLSPQAVKLLALLLALGAGTMAVLWWRTMREGPVGEWTGEAPASVFDGAQPAQPQPVEPVLQPQPAAAPVQRAPVQPPQPAVRPQAPAAPAAPVVNLQAPGTMLRVETLAATFEEVEFLASLGLWTDAMDILKAYLQDSAAPAPLAYYELMRLCIQVDDAAALVSVRKRYAQVFGVEPPRFEQISAPLGIETYPELAGRLTAAWGTREALDFIELTLFTVAPLGKAISLEAGRDLLFLHDLAMAELRDSVLQGEGEHALAPWAHGGEEVRRGPEDMPDYAGGHNFALDLDLSAEAPGPKAENNSQFLDFDLETSQQAALRAAQVEAERVRGDDEPPPSAAMPLDRDGDPFSAAVATERMRRK